MPLDVLAAASESVLRQLKAPDHYDEAYPDLETMAGELEQLAKRLRRYANNGLPRTKSETLEVEALCRGVFSAAAYHAELTSGREQSSPLKKHPELRVVS